MSAIDPSSIMSLSTGYWASQTLLTANRIKLFDALADGATSSLSLAEKLELDPRATKLLLNACVSLGLCEKEANQYSNSLSSAKFLTSARPASMGNAISYSDDLFATWGELEKAVRTGVPPMPAVSYLGEDEQQTRHFVYGMHDRAMAIGRALPDMLDLEGRKKMLDVGGGPGTYSALLTERFPGLKSDVIELPGVAKIAHEILAKMGADSRVNMLSGDYHSTEFGSGYDVVLMSGMFHRETEEKCRHLIEKARNCLEPGGLLVVSDIFADEGGTGPAFAALFGLNMMLTADDGGVHADADVAQWLVEGGFGQVDRQSFPPPMPHRIVTGVKS